VAGGPQFLFEPTGRRLASHGNRTVVPGRPPAREPDGPP
jgi:hypothetical protein